MIINLSKDYRVITDAHQYILQTKHVSEKGKDYEVTKGYYANMDMLIQKMLELELKENEIEEFKELNQLLKDTAEEVSQNVTVAIKEAGGEPIEEK